jgi:hypothetical protein
MILAVRLAVAPGVWKIDMIRNRHYIPPRRYLYFFVPKAEHGHPAAVERAEETV